ncbi:MAG: topoisomerase DNA-binding C4 zinc finger domain-containing protein [Atribacterota bacterium]|jgi:ssDNA-binding Zn-finger/Zn-ribbon topoisomerase 1|nr:topoisomerase DNA-binding C4 zinc finger domain-containing protein [Atribacterota bacterium]
MADNIPTECPNCGSPLKERQGAYGRFLGCSNYPDCKYTYNLSGGYKEKPRGDKPQPISFTLNDKKKLDYIYRWTKSQDKPEVDEDTSDIPLLDEQENQPI